MLAIDTVRQDIQAAEFINISLSVGLYNAQVKDAILGCPSFRNNPRTKNWSVGLR